VRRWFCWTCTLLARIPIRRKALRSPITRSISSTFPQPGAAPHPLGQRWQSALGDASRGRFPVVGTTRASGSPCVAGRCAATRCRGEIRPRRWPSACAISRSEPQLPIPVLRQPAAGRGVRSRLIDSSILPTAGIADCCKANRCEFQRQDAGRRLAADPLETAAGVWPAVLRAAARTVHQGAVFVSGTDLKYAGARPYLHIRGLGEQVDLGDQSLYAHLTSASVEQRQHDAYGGLAIRITSSPARS